MAKNTRLSELRDAMAMISHDIAKDDSDGIATKTAVLARVRQEKFDEIDEIRDHLIEMSLTSLLKQAVSRRKNNSFVSEWSDLIEGLAGIPDALPDGKGNYKLFSKMTIREVASYVTDHDTKAVNSKNKIIKMILRYCRNNMKSEDDAIGEVLNVIRQERGVISLSSGDDGPAEFNFMLQEE